jgi:hypothetical protein
MQFNTHPNLANTHALFSASSPHWVNYELDKLERVFFEKMTAARGTQLHAFAHQAIVLGIRLPDNGSTLSSYVNDGIGFQMQSEQVLKATPNFFGTPDTIKFSDDTLRIHDLKNGVTPAKMLQLYVYAAYFCLEYRFSPFDIKIELRIYQNDDIQSDNPDPDDIFHIMEKVRYFDTIIEKLKAEVFS